MVSSDVKLIYAAYELDKREAIANGKMEPTDLSMEEVIVHGFEFTDERYRD